MNDAYATPVEWAIVELMGHRQRAGMIREVEMFGAKMLQIQIPAGDDFVTEIYGGPAIYSIRPATEEIARRFATDRGDVRPVRPVDYLPAISQQPRDEEFDEIDDEERPL